jgi:hypothetical protein
MDCYTGPLDSQGLPFLLAPCSRCKSEKAVDWDGMPIRSAVVVVCRRCGRRSAESVEVGADLKMTEAVQVAAWNEMNEASADYPRTPEAAFDRLKLRRKILDEWMVEARAVEARGGSFFDSFLRSHRP